MSPVSKKRRPSRRTARKAGSARTGLSARLDQIDKTMRSLRLSPDPLGSEAYASQLIASFVVPDGGLDRDTLERFLAALHGRSTAESLALLRASSSVVPNFEMRAISGAYADSLASSGTSEPRWRGECERTRLVDAYEFADVYGDQRTIMCTYTGPTEKHALVGFVNTTHLGGHLEDIVLTTSIDRAVSGFSSRAAQSDGLVTFGLVRAEVAHEVLAAALANSYRTEGVADEVVALRALLGARLALTAPELPKHASAPNNSNDWCRVSWLPQHSVTTASIQTIRTPLRPYRRWSSSVPSSTPAGSPD
ncbi:hypothetical protein BJF84_14215 [Rhodococcus sp. CUA-806]|nr:hypothetical protein BJF84_14215 [Rhodococcus sp. CUA-806]